MSPVTILLLAGGMAAFGSATPVSRLVSDTFPIWLASGMRMAVTAVVLLPLLARRDDGTGVRSFEPADWWRMAAIGLIGTFGFTALLFLGMERVPGAIGAVVMATAPAITAVGAVLFLSDRLGPWRIGAVGLAVAGVAVANVSSGGAGGGTSPLLGSLLVLGAVVCEATYSLVGKRLTADVDPVQITFAAAVVAGVALLPLAVWDAARFDWDSATAGDWVGLLWWGAGTMALGSVLWFSGMRRVEAGTAAPFMGVMPVSALVLSYVLLDEPFRWLHLAGMALVLAGLAAVIRSGADAH